MTQGNAVAWRGWLIWGCGAAFFAYAFSHRVAPSVMFDHLMADFAADATRLGQLSACYFYAYAAIQIPVGLLLDRFGPRRALTLSAIACMARVNRHAICSSPPAISPSLAPSAVTASASLCTREDDSVRLRAGRLRIG